MISKLHYITQGNIPEKTHQELAELACKGGIDWVQLRVKNAAKKDVQRIAEETLLICRQYGAKLIINDHVDIALQIGADGIHVGKKDMPLNKVKDKVGDKLIIGATANTLEDILSASNYGVDYVGLGPFAFTKTKDVLSPIISLNAYSEIITELKKQQINTPIIAIGGITEHDVLPLYKVGLHGVAIASGINASENPTSAAKSYIRISS